MLDFAIATATSAGAYIRERAKGALEVEHKGRIDLVTQVDKGAQALIVAAIEERYPSHGILAEEGLSKPGRDGYTWIVDPLDGTTNFVHRLPIFCVSLALYRDRQPVVGVCYNPMSDELFTAEAGRGAMRNGVPIRVGSARQLVDALTVTGFPYRSERMDLIQGRFFRVVNAVQGIRRLGSAALDLCYVACGVFDAYWEEGLHPWDIAAGALIVQEAGGVVSNLDGTPLDLEQGGIAASNPFLHGALLELM